MLVQMDASPFAWLEGRGPSMSLHGAIDDATEMVPGLYFRPEEDTLGYVHFLKQIVKKHGIPKSLYSDGHTIFFSPKHGKLSIEEELAVRKVNLTQFARAIEQLGIGHIRALSPQAKGRVERLRGTLQHRLMVELRLAKATTLEEANEFLVGFIDRFNSRFAVEGAVIRRWPLDRHRMRICQSLLSVLERYERHLKARLFHLRELLINCSTPGAL